MSTDYRINGHALDVVKEYDSGGEVVECEECLAREAILEDDDAESLALTLPDECHIEWLRMPDGGFRGFALRNGGCFQGRELIGVKEGGEVVDTVRIYDDDAPLLADLLDKGSWEQRGDSS